MRLSLGGKIAVLIVIVAILLNGTCIIVSDAVNRKTMDKEYMITADSMASTVAVTVNGDKIQELTESVMELYHRADSELDSGQWEEVSFSEQYYSIMNSKEYIETQNELRHIQDVSEVDRVYVVYICPEHMKIVMIADGAYENTAIPASFEVIDETYYTLMDNLEQGIPAYIKDTEFGHVATSCAPIYNSNGEIVCFASVDLSMNDVISKENHFLFIITAVLMIMTIVICIFSILYVRHKIVKPINMLSEAAEKYGQKQSGDVHGGFSSISIHTGDELEILLNSMIQMEKDIDSYIRNLTKTKAQLSSAQQKADDMHELAHMDSLTGIRNRLAYDKKIILLDSEIKKGLPVFGIVMVDLNFLKSINDTYGHECGNSAIILLSQLICKIFSNSPVFRIGGDEFAVILKNHDYDKIDSLIAEFRQEIEKFQTNQELNPWERISAAIGYALFEKNTDHCADDVFKRADYNMYQHKKEMKAIRND